MTISVLKSLCPQDTLPPSDNWFQTLSPWKKTSGPARSLSRPVPESCGHRLRPGELKVRTCYSLRLPVSHRSAGSFPGCISKSRSDLENTYTQEQCLWESTSHTGKQGGGGAGAQGKTAAPPQPCPSGLQRSTAASTVTFTEVTERETQDTTHPTGD